MSPSLQGRLLRLLADGEVERVGSTETLRVDVRVVLSLTPSMPDAWPASGDMLPELISRLSVFTVEVPPLRERIGDVRLLAEHFLRKYAQRNPRAATSLAAEATLRLEAYDWPGNVRELENIIERAAILSRSDVIQPEHLAFGAKPRVASSPAIALSATAAPEGAPPMTLSGEVVGQPSPGTVGHAGGARPGLDSQLEDIERRELLAALDRCGGNKAEVARSLGMQRTTLYYRLKRLGIET